MLKQIVVLCLLFVLCLTAIINKNDVSSPNKYLNKCFENTANLLLHTEKLTKNDTPVDTATDFDISTPIANLTLHQVVGRGLQTIRISNVSIDLDNNKLQYIYSNHLFIWKQNYTAKFLINGDYETNQGTGKIMFHNGDFLASFQLSPMNNKLHNGTIEVLSWTIDFSKLGDIESNPKRKEGIDAIKKNFLTSQMKQICGTILVPFTEAVLKQCVVKYGEIL